MDTPNNSFSQAALSSGETSSPLRVIPSIRGVSAWSVPPNRLVWPELRVRVSNWAVAIIWSSAASNEPREPRLSKAPAFTRLSRVRRFRPLTSARRQNSSIDSKGPFSSRSATRGLTAPSPTVLMAARPNLRLGVGPLSLSIVKNSPERFMSGSSTGICNLEHSLTELTIRSVLSSLELRTEHMYSSG